MYKVFEMCGNSAGVLKCFDNFEEAQDFLIEQTAKDTEELKKDDSEADKASLYELASSYYSIQKDLKWFFIKSAKKDIIS